MCDNLKQMYTLYFTHYLISIISLKKITAHSCKTETTISFS